MKSLQQELEISSVGHPLPVGRMIHRGPLSEFVARRSWIVICGLTAFSLAIRIAALIYWGTGAIENEGAEYARIAQNLRNGAGYVGISIPGVELLFNPLYS